MSLYWLQVLLYGAFLVVGVSTAAENAQMASDGVSKQGKIPQPSVNYLLSLTNQRAEKAEEAGHLLKSV